jgi:uncharacterized protein (TIGR03118 family)
MRKHLATFAAAGAAALIGGAMLVGSARAGGDDDDRGAERQGAYKLTELVTSVMPPPKNVTLDPNLKNPWGVANAPGGPLWVADNATQVSTVYTDDGKIVDLVVTIPPTDGTPPSAPTGMVWNPNPGQFFMPRTKIGATFIFDGEDGRLTAWNPTTNPIKDGKSTATVVYDNSASGAVYKGLAFGTNRHGNFLFATNFRAGTVDVFDTSFTPVDLKKRFEGTFSDPGIPMGYAPFGIANIGGDLFVTYALQDADKQDDVAGDGHGFVDVFRTNGERIRRLVSHGPLNSPWGLARASNAFGKFAGAILVGNFGAGRQFGGVINAFTDRGELLGQLRMPNGKAISVVGLWSISIGYNTFQGADPDTLYFTAGIQEESQGLLGKITVVRGWP